MHEVALRALKDHMTCGLPWSYCLVEEFDYKHGAQRGQMIAVMQGARESASKVGGDVGHV